MSQEAPSAPLWARAVEMVAKAVGYTLVALWGLFWAVCALGVAVTILGGILGANI